MKRGLIQALRELLKSDPKLTLEGACVANPGYSRGCVRNMLYRARKGFGVGVKKGGKVVGVNKAPEQEREMNEERKESADSYWEDRYGVLRKKYEQALEELVLVDRLVEMAGRVAPRSYDPAPDLVPVSRGDGSAQSAVLLLSDTHIGKIVDPGQTLYFGRYNFQVFLERLKHLETRIVSILQEHTNTKINKLVVAMLGDMVDGALAHSAEAATQATRFAQVYMGAHAIAQFLRNLSAYVPAIEVVTCVGNHGRWGDQHKMPTKNRYSNLDMFLYAQVQALVSGIPKIKMQLNRQPFQTIMVEQSFMWFGHGDHLRGGDKAMGIPVHAIGRQLSSVAQMHAKHGRAVPNIYCVGDKHKRIELPHALGDFIVNGAFPGYDEYAHSSNFTDAGADQKFFLVHPKYGRGATYNIYLSHAPEVEKPYSLPEGFEIQ